MKNMFLALVGAALLSTGACRQVDKELVGKLEGEITQIDQKIPELDGHVQRSSELVKKMESAPTGLKFNPNYNFSQLYETAKAINLKYSTIMSMHRQAKESLDSLIRSYSNGDVKKEDVAAEFANITASIEALDKTPAVMQPVFDELQVNYEKLSATYLALPEEQRNQIEKELMSTQAPGASAAPPTKDH